MISLIAHKTIKYQAATFIESIFQIKFWRYIEFIHILHGLYSATPHNENCSWFWNYYFIIFPHRRVPIFGLRIELVEVFLSIHQLCNCNPQHQTPENRKRFVLHWKHLYLISPKNSKATRKFNIEKNKAKMDIIVCDSLV